MVEILEKYPIFAEKKFINPHTDDFLPSIDVVREQSMEYVLIEADKLRWKFNYLALEELLSEYEVEIMSYFQNSPEHIRFLIYQACCDFYLHGNKEKAMVSLQKALSIAKFLGDEYSHYLVMIYRERGSIHRWTDNHEVAEEDYQQALKVLGKQMNSEWKDNWQIELLYCLGAIFDETAQYESGAKVVDKALSKESNHYADRIYYLKAKLDFAREDIEACEESLQIARAFNKHINRNNLHSYFVSLELSIKLAKAGIYSHDGKSLLLHTHDKISEIYAYYSKKASVRKAFAEYGAQKQREELENF